MRFFKKTEFMQWDDYKQKIDNLDIFWWRQSVRRHNLKV